MSDSREHESILARTAALVFALDDEGEVRYASPRAGSTLGLEGELLLGRPLAERVHDEDRPVYESRLAGEATGHPDDAVEVRVRHVAGHWLVLEMVFDHLRDAPGDPARVVITARDVSDRREREERRFKERRMEAIGQLAGGVAHDFNNLLAAVTAAADLLSGELPRDDPRRELVQDIQNATAKARFLTDELLAFGRRQVLEPKLIDLNRVVRDLRPLIGRLAGETIACSCDLAAEPSQVRADPTQLERVILNLVSNARDAMAPHGGRIRLTTANVELGGDEGLPAVRVEPGRYVQLAVSDTGPGIDPRVRNWIFEPFFTTKGGGRGHGLGLATVYGIVKQSGGYIWCRNQEDGGTVFEIQLPQASTRELAAKPSSEAEAAPAGGTETILLAEDDPAIRRLLSKILSLSGYRVIDAESAGAALAAAEAEPGSIELLISDVVLPDRPGHELAQLLTERRPEVEILLISGYTDAAALASESPFPQYEFIQKPFTKAILLGRVRALLEGREAEPSG